MTDKVWVVVPSAGAGSRMSADQPKQYLPLAGKTVLAWSLAPFLASNRIAGIVVVLAQGDDLFAASSIPALAQSANRRVMTTTGGATRSDSVSNGLKALAAAESDWVLVHDAARPCLHPDDLQRLIDQLKDDEVGGLLAAPVTDTLKVGDVEQRVSSTPSRDGLWRALTPQMFRFGVLSCALVAARGNTVTDESAAVELLGQKPKLVMGRADNIKITVPEDLAYAEFILRRRT